MPINDLLNPAVPADAEANATSQIQKILLSMAVDLGNGSGEDIVEQLTRAADALEAIDTKVGTMNGHLDGLEGALASIATAIGGVETYINTGLSAVAAQMVVGNAHLGNLVTETAANT